MKKETALFLHHKITLAFHLFSRIKTTANLLTKTVLILHSVDCLKKNG